MIGHGRMYEEILRVPLIIRIPDSQPSRIQDSVESIDIMPTVLDILNLSIPPGLDGRSLMKEAGVRDPERAVYSEHFVSGNKLSLKYKGFKLIYFESRKRFEFYSLTVDPKEENNIAGGTSPIELRMKKMLSKRIAKAGRALAESSAGSAEGDEATLKQLRALGHLQ